MFHCLLTAAQLCSCVRRFAWTDGLNDCHIFGLHCDTCSATRMATFLAPCADQMLPYFMRPTMRRNSNPWICTAQFCDARVVQGASIGGPFSACPAWIAHRCRICMQVSCQMTRPSVDTDSRSIIGAAFLTAITMWIKLPSSRVDMQF